MTENDKLSGENSVGAVVAVYATFPALDKALEIGRVLVEKRLAACVNAWPGMTSVYHWEGQVETGSETVAIIKTTSELAKAVIAEIERLHPYDTPAIVVLPVLDGSERYLAWVKSEAGG